MPTTVDLILHAKWLVPIIPENTVLTDCALVIDKGKILAIKPSSGIHKDYQGRQEHDLDQHVLMPGLINAHCHSAMTLLRGYADDLPLKQWLEEHIWPAEARFADALFVKEGSTLAIAEMIRSGTTCFSDMYFYPEETAAVAHQTGIRCQLAFPVLEFETRFAKHANDYISKGLSLHDRYRSHSRINIAFGPHAPYTVSDTSLTRISGLAAEIHANVHIHLHETKQEVEDALAQTQMRPIERLEALHLLTPHTQCVHMTALDDSDIDKLQTSGAHVIHCPESNAKLASGLCPVSELLKAGVNVALGTDGAASNNNLDMFGEMHSAALLGKLAAKDASALSAAQVLAMATINGAKALGIDDKVGSLTVGKSADIIAIALDELEQQPLHHVLSTLVYTHCGHKVTHSWVAGKMLMNERQLTCLSIEDTITKAKHWQQRMKGK